MRKAAIIIAFLVLAAPAISKTATLETDSTETVNIGGEEIQYELIGVNPDTENPEKVDATLIDGDQMTHTIVSWNAHQYDLNGYQYTQSEVNGEEIVLDSWTGADTDSNEDDTATLAWGRDYFHCEGYQTSEDEYKFCGDETKTVEVGGEEVELEFMYSSTTNEHDEIKTAVFLNSDGGTVTLNSPKAPEYDYTTSALNGVQVDVKQVRGAMNDRSSDDAALIEVNSQTCTYDFTGSVQGHRYQDDGVTGEVHIGDGMTQITRDGTFGFTKTAECGSTVTVEYREEGNVIASTQVDLPEQGEEVSGIEIDARESEDNEEDWTVREIERITDYLGGNIDNIEPKTEIKFGDNLQNTLYVHSVEGSYSRDLEIQASAGSKNSDQFTLSWDNLVNGVTKEFNSGEYTVHLCGDSDPGNGGVTVAISKYDGSQGYGACFNDEKQGREEASEYSRIEYEEGDKVRAAPGEKLVFGQNVLFVDSYNYEDNIERYTLESYANKLTDNHRLGPVRGTSTEGYFYDGEYNVYFCEYYESEEEGELMVSQDENECADQEEDETGNDEGTFEVELNPIEYENQGMAIFALPINGEVPLEQLSDDCPITGGQVYGYESGGTATSTLNGMRGYAAFMENTQSCTATVERSAVTGTLDISLPDNEWVVASVPKEMTVRDLSLTQGCSLNGIGDTAIWEITNEGNQPLDYSETLQPDGLYWIRAQGESCQIELETEIFNIPE